MPRTPKIALDDPFWASARRWPKQATPVVFIADSPTRSSRLFPLRSIEEPARREEGESMPSVKRHALKILAEYGEAQSALKGKAVVLTDGKAGTVQEVCLDDMHGLRILIRGHYGKWPVSTIKFWER
jgi:hypothetical protein